MASSQPPSQPQHFQLQVRLQPPRGLGAGHYANAAAVAVTEHEILIDFFSIGGSIPKQDGGMESDVVHITRIAWPIEKADLLINSLQQVKDARARGIAKKDAQ